MVRARLEFHPATAGRWSDLAKLFGPRGACAGCWCMWPRLARAEFRAGVGEKNRRALRSIVAAGEPPGILAYVDGEPAGWCAVGPRAIYRRYEKSKTLAPVDDQPVWSVVCFFVARPYRRQGLSVRLLREAVRYAAARGARIVEGYPTDSRARIADAWVWTGVAAAFGDRARELGIAGILGKPLPPAELVAEVKRVLALTRRRQVLLVEDEAGLRRLEQRLLEEEGCEVDVAADGREALTLVAGRTYDAIILDLRMPHVDGHEVAKQIRHSEANRGTPVVMVTGTGDAAARRKGFENQIVLFLHKPFTAEAFRTMIRGVLD